MKYKTKPCEIEAEQIRLNMVFNPVIFPATLSNNPFDACEMRRPKWYKSPVPMIKTLEGWLTVSPGDFIIKGLKGEFYPCKPDIFEMKYEPVSPHPNK